jgi:hypothetical protein
MAKAYKSEAFAALHESMSDLHKAGAIDTGIEAFSGGHPPDSSKGIREPGGLCGAFECDDRGGQQMGAWRETAARTGGQIADACRQTWHSGYRLNAVVAGAASKPVVVQRPGAPGSWDLGSFRGGSNGY